MKSKLIYFASGILLLLSIGASIHGDPLELLLSNLKLSADTNRQEKVYLHMDKPYYTAGDHIWFKAYVLDEYSLNPSTMSQVLYVELINEKKAIRALKLPLENGISWGDILLSDSIPAGNYRIRAYTQWMRNAGEEFFFDKKIAIGSGLEKIVIASGNLERSTQNGVAAISGVIKFSDEKGYPYKNKPIALQLQIDGENNSTIKGNTDSVGQIKVDFEKIKEVSAVNMRVMAVLQFAPEKQVVKLLQVKNAERAFDVQFFPEGGQIVKGIPCKIVVKAINSNRHGEVVTGILASKEMENVKFTTNRFGLGYFYLNASSSSELLARVTFNDGTQRDFPLPKIADSGYTLALTATQGQNRTAQISLSADLLNTGQLSLVGQRNGHVYFMQKIPTNKQVSKIAFNTNKLPSGVLQLSLLSPQNLPVAERYAFINNAYDKLNIKIEGIKSSYAKRSLVEFSMNATQQQISVGGSFSVSVINTTIIQPDIENETNILTSFLLSSDSPDYIEKPNYYVNDTAVGTQDNVDLLMLTSSWRHMPWQTIMQKSPTIVRFPIEHGLVISGTLTNAGKPVPHGKVTLMKSAGGLEMVTGTSDELGRFRFDSLYLQDSTKLLIQARTAGDKKNVKIKIDQTPSQGVTIDKDYPDNVLDVDGKLIEYMRERGALLNEQIKKGLLSSITNIEEVRIKVRRVRGNLMTNYGIADRIFTSKDLDSAGFLSTVLNGQVRGDYTKYKIILDGILMEQESRMLLMQLDPAEIERIEVVSPSLLVITSKKNTGYSKISYAPGVATITPIGFSYSDIFHSPDYDSKKDGRFDSRSTIYWNPNLTVSENGKVKVQYFNADIPGNYRVIIEGVGGNGGLGRREIYYEVK